MKALEIMAEESKRFALADEFWSHYTPEQKSTFMSGFPDVDGIKMDWEVFINEERDFFDIKEYTEI